VIELVKRFKKEVSEEEIRRVYIREKKKKLLNSEADIFKKSKFL